MSNKVYIIRDHAIGDVIWVEPVIRYFLGKGKKVYFIGIRSFVYNSHNEKNLIVKKRLNFFEKLLFYYDKFVKPTGLFIDLNGAYEMHPKQHVLTSYFQRANINDYSLTYPKIYFKPDHSVIEFAPLNYVVIHLEADRYKNYRNVYGVTWELIIPYLKSKGLEVVSIGKKKDDRFSHWIETDNFDKLATLISNAKIFIGVDSAPSHIAAATGIPSLIFFGSVNPLFRHLPSFKGFFLQQKCEFAGCYHDTEKPGGKTCVLVGDEGIPKCSLHTDRYIINYIDKLIEKFQLT